MGDDADPISVEAAVPAAKCQSLQATRLPLQLPRSPFHSRLRTNAFTLPKQRERFGAFTLAELLVTVSVLVLLVFLATQLLNSAATVTVLGNKKMDADSEARQILDRMGFDFAQMLKRNDVDYFLKSSSGTASDCGACGAEAGNDQAAFYTTVAGYYPTPTASPIGASSVSLVSYRVNSDSTSSSYTKMERMSKGLAWNGVSAGFVPNSSLTPVVFLPQTIGGNWPAACYPVCTSNPSYSTDSAYEAIGQQVFRFEYYYLLKNGSFSVTPWDTTPTAGHTNVSGMRDVSAIIVDIAVIDPKSKVLLSNSDIAGLTGNLADYSGQAPGVLLAAWRTAIDANTSLPRPALSGIRMYERYFYLTH
jgi:hypothetical protein